MKNNNNNFSQAGVSRPREGVIVVVQLGVVEHGPLARPVAGVVRRRRRQGRRRRRRRGGSTGRFVGVVHGRVLALLQVALHVLRSKMLRDDDGNDHDDDDEH